MIKQDGVWKRAPLTNYQDEIELRDLIAASPEIDGDLDKVAAAFTHWSPTNYPEGWDPGPLAELDVARLASFHQRRRGAGRGGRAGWATGPTAFEEYRDLVEEADQLRSGARCSRPS